MYPSTCREPHHTVAEMDASRTLANMRAIATKVQLGQPLIAPMKNRSNPQTAEIRVNCKRPMEADMSEHMDAKLNRIRQEGTILVAQKSRKKTTLN